MLTKLPHSQYIPAIRGVAAVPEHTVCTPAPPVGPPASPGHWITVCEAIRVLVGTWTRDDANYGRCSASQIGTPKYVDAGVACRSEWVAG